SPCIRGGRKKKFFKPPTQTREGHLFCYRIIDRRNGAARDGRPNMGWNMGSNKEAKTCESGCDEAAEIGGAYFESRENTVRVCCTHMLHCDFAEDVPEVGR